MSETVPVQARLEEEFRAPLGSLRTWLGVSVLGMAAAACGGGGSSDCLLLPCAIPLAVSLDVSSSTGEAVTGVVVQVSGATNGTNPCNIGPTVSTCYVMGTAGTYELAVVAPGFQTARRTVTVSGTAPQCGCPTAVTQHLLIVLTLEPKTQQARPPRVGGR